MAYNPHGEALGKLAIITDALRNLDVSYVELTPPEFENSFAVGAAVRVDSDFVVITVPLGGQFEAYITGGALLDVAQEDKLGVLTICNNLTSSWSTPACYLHDAEDTWSILVQLKFLLPVVNDVPPYFRALIGAVASTLSEAREAFATAGITGRAWSWDPQNLKRLLIKTVF